jgi:hypothetical protein
MRLSIINARNPDLLQWTGSFGVRDWRKGAKSSRCSLLSAESLQDDDQMV